MAGGKVEWILSIIDKASAPASVVERKLGMVEKRLKALDKAAREASTPATKERIAFQKLGLELQRDQMLMRKLKDESGAWIQKLHSGLAVVGMIGGALRTVTRAMVDVGLGAARFTAGFGRKGLEAAAYKESNLAALEMLLGSKGRAEGVFEQGRRFAASTPFETTDVLRWQKNLLVGGFKADELSPLLKGMGDLAAMNDFDTQVVDRVALAFKQIRAKGKLQGGEMMQLSEAGVNTGLVYERLAKQLGVDNDTVRKMQERGEISANRAIHAVLETIRDTVSGGKLGATMDKFGKGTLAGLLSTLRSKPADFLMDLDKSGGFKTFKSAVSNLIDTLDAKSESGQRIAKTLDRVFTSLFESTLGKFTGPDGAKRVEETVDQLLVGFEKLTNVGQTVIAAIEGITTGLLKGFDPAGELFGEGALSPEKLAKVAEAGERVGSALAKVLVPIINALGDVTNEKTVGGNVYGGMLEDVSKDGFFWGGIKSQFLAPFRALEGMSNRSAAAVSTPVVPPPAPRDWRDGLGQAMARNLNVRVDAPVNVAGALTPEEAREAGRQTGEAVTASLMSAAQSQGA